MRRWTKTVWPTVDGLGVDVPPCEWAWRVMCWPATFTKDAMIYFWGLLAGLGAVTCEAMFKAADRYQDVMLWSIPLALLINYSVFRMVQLAPSLPSAFIVFAAVTLSCRIGWSLYAGHTISTATWAAVALNVLAMGVRRWE